MNVLLPTLDQHLQVHGCETLNISISSNMLMLNSTILYLVGTCECWKLSVVCVSRPEYGGSASGERAG